LALADAAEVPRLTNSHQVPYLRCHNLELKVGFRTLLKNIQIELFAGKSVALTGPNGLGKTTLLRCLAGPHSGGVWIANEALWPTRRVTFEHDAVLLASQPALLADHPVQGNIEFMCNAFGLKPTVAEINGALERVGLKGRESQVSRTLSTGQKRRLTLAFVLVAKPKLLLADEPTNGLDAEGVELCKQVFAEEMNHNEMALCVASHDSRLVDWCHQIVPLENFMPTKSSERNVTVAEGIFK
jgi:ABC-2 type transport system ATP-binding protein